MRKPVALVTGAAGGIGASIVSELLADGFEVIATDLQAPKSEPKQDSVQYIQADLVNESDIDVLMQSIPNGTLDALVNAAGVAFFQDDGSVFDITDSIWERTLGVNLDGMRKITKAALPLLRKSPKASIVNIASVAGLRGMDSPLDAYQVSKAAVVSLSQSIAIQLGPEGIRCNTICPGAILTPMIEYLYAESPERRDSMEERTPLRRLGLPKDISSVVAFLVSEKASFITGTDIVVDGGWTAQIK